VRLGFNKSCNALLPVPATSRSLKFPPADPKAVEVELALELAAVGVVEAASLSLRRENAGPVSRRSKAISAGDLSVGCELPTMGDATLVGVTLTSWLIGSSGAGPKIFSTGISGSVIGPKLGSGASPAA
jgi:hypothetical protein